jgi:parallel beta-helix repeat protein
MIVYLLLFLILTSGIAQATTWRVNKLGSEGNSCDTARGTAPTDAKLTINGALSCISASVGAGAGHTVEVAAGSYNERISNIRGGTSWGAVFTLTAKAGDTVTLKPLTSSGGSRIVESSTNSFWVLNGFIVDGTNQTGEAASVGMGSNTRVINNEFINNNGNNAILSEGNGSEIQLNKFHGGNFEGTSASFLSYPIYHTGSNATIERNELWNFPSFGIHINDSAASSANNNIVRRNIIRNATAGGSEGNGSCAIITSNTGGSSNQIYNNLIYNNVNKHGICVSLSSHTVYNNTVYGNTYAGIYINASTSVTAKNNIVVNNGGDAILLETSTLTTTTHNLCPVGSNCADRINGTLSGGGTTVFSNTPRFVDVANADFRLCLEAGNPTPCTAKSPAIDVGTTLATVTTDLAGTTRPIGGVYDIGAYEAGITVPTEPVGAYVARYSFDNVATDSTVNVNNGIITGATYTTGQYNQGLSFNGTSNVVTVADSASLDLTHGFTLAAWVKPSGAMTTFKAIAVKSYVFYLYASSEGICGPGSVLAGYDTGTAAVNACYATALTPGIFTHVAATYDRTAVRIYIHGNLATSAAGSAFMPVTAGALTIGASEFGEWFGGVVDEVHVRNTALTQAEIQTLMATALNPIVNNPGLIIGPSGLTLGAASAAIRFASSISAVGSASAILTTPARDTLVTPAGDRVIVSE